MKLPVLWIAAAFAAGIALASSAAPAMQPKVWLAFGIAALLASLGLLRRGWLPAAWVAGLLGWAFLGALAARAERAAIPPNQITKLLAEGRIDTSVAHRWRGRLREEPIRLPWGMRFDVDLQEVELPGGPLAVTGGLRISQYRMETSAVAGEASELPFLRARIGRAGDRVEALLRARPPHNYGNPGAFDARANLARQGIHLTGTLRSLELLQKVGEPSPTLAHRLARVRGRLLERLDDMFAGAPDRAAVLRAMLLGDRNFIDHQRAEAFQKSAAYHVLVISGLHVAALAVFVLWAARRLRMGVAASTVATLAVLAGYVAVVEDRPPILRAALMATAYLLARLFFRRVELLNTIAVAALIILAVRPSALSDPSFQLSFLAVGTIGALAAPWIDRSSQPYRRALEHLSDVTRDGGHPPRATQFRLDARAATGWLTPRLPARLARYASAVITLPCAGALRLWEVVVLSATIQLGMLPLLAHYFHRVSLAGPLANVPAVLLTGLIVPVGFLALGTSLLWKVLGNALGKLLGGLVGALVASIEGIAQWRGASYRIPGPPAWLLAAFFLAAVMLALAVRARRTRREVLLALPVAALAILIATYPFAPKLEPGKLEVTVLDVGQGDSIFVAFPDGRTMLIDGGGTPGASRIRQMRTSFDVGEEVVSPYLWTRGLKRLEVVALTHAHQDHIGGLGAVLENFRVRELWLGRDVDTTAFSALLDIARARGARVVHHIRGEDFTWGGVAGQALWPESSDLAETAKNNDSLVLHLKHGRIGILLPGDIERRVENTLVANGDELRADFLKVPHHGSKTSTSLELLADVAPRWAVISVGETNPFGHPNAEVIGRLRAAAVRVFQTDRDGAVTALSDGRSLRVHSFAEGNSR